MSSPRPSEAAALRRRHDVVVVGAGTAGAAAAALCARRGLSVLCLDRRPLGEAGARWVNDVPAWCFDEAGIDRPAGLERYGVCADAHLFAGFGPERVTVRGHGCLAIDMRRLVARLQELARAAGAALAGEVEVRGLDASGRLETSRGAVEARFVVDASGVAGSRLLRQPRPERRDLCAAAQEVRRVRDPGGARAFFEAHRAGERDAITYLGVAGGFSTLSLRLAGDEVCVLAGSIPAEGQPGGAALVRDLVARERWIGERVFGGARAIPLRAAYGRIAAGRVALLGDAACQVFAAHGSGVGAGLVAARLLADALACGEGLEGYAVRWQRRFGALHAAYDLFRRFSQRLEARDFARLMRAGLMREDTVRAAIDQRWPAPSLASGPAIVAGLLREPALAGRLVAVAGRMAAARLHWARYPREPARVGGWARTAGRLLGAAV